MVAQLLPSDLDGNGEGLALGAEECWMAGLMAGLARAGRWVLSGAVSTEICLISQNWEVLFFPRMLQGSQLP